MEFLYGTSFMSQSPEAYERLILDAMRGDATLFTRNDEVDAQWSIIDPILQAWDAGSPPLAEYEAGTPGPAEADELIGEGRHWRPLWSGRGLVGARHDAGAGSRPRCATSSSSTTTPTIRSCPRACSTSSSWSTASSAARSRTGFERVGRYHPSRLVLCAVEDGRTTIDAWAGVGTDDAEPRPGHIAVARERVELEIGPRHLAKLDTIVDPLLVSDLATMVWAPHGHTEAIDSLRRLAQIVLVDTPGRARRGARRSAAPPSSSELRLRGRPRVAALDAVARARGGRVRPAGAARGARQRLRGHRPPPRRTRSPPRCCSAAGCRRGSGWKPESLVAARRRR